MRLIGSYIRYRCLYIYAVFLNGLWKMVQKWYPHTSITKSVGLLNIKASPLYFRSHNAFQRNCISSLKDSCNMRINNLEFLKCLQHLKSLQDSTPAQPLENTMTF